MIRIKKDWQPRSPAEYMLGPITAARTEADWTVSEISAPVPLPARVLTATRGNGQHPVHLDELRAYLDPAAVAKRFATWKASLRITASASPDRFAEARAHVEGGYTCSGISAAWCPNCGDCTCPRDEDGSPVTRVRETAFASRTLVSTEVVRDPSCPLHSPDSPHAKGKVE